MADDRERVESVHNVVPHHFEVATREDTMCVAWACITLWTRCILLPLVLHSASTPRTTRRPRSRPYRNTGRPSSPPPYPAIRHNTILGSAFGPQLLHKGSIHFVITCDLVRSPTQWHEATGDLPPSAAGLVQRTDSPPYSMSCDRVFRASGVEVRNMVRR